MSDCAGGSQAKILLPACSGAGWAKKGPPPCPALALEFLSPSWPALGKTQLELLWAPSCHLPYLVKLWASLVAPGKGSFTSFRDSFPLSSSSELGTRPRWQLCSICLDLGRWQGVQGSRPCVPCPACDVSVEHMERRGQGPVSSACRSVPSSPGVGPPHQPSLPFPVPRPPDGLPPPPPPLHLPIPVLPSLPLAGFFLSLLRTGSCRPQGSPTSQGTKGLVAHCSPSTSAGVIRRKACPVHFVWSHILTACHPRPRLQWVPPPVGSSV